MKTFFILLLSAAFMAYTAEPKITFAPFSVTFEKPYLPFAMFFLIISVSLYMIQSEKTGYDKGVKDTIDAVREALKDDEL